MKQFFEFLHVSTRGKGFYPITREVSRWIASTGVDTGLLTVFCQHTSASLVIQENADPDVVKDLADYFERIAPENDPSYRHSTEGPDDMPAHIRTALTHTSVSIPIVAGQMTLGAWQGIYVFEHRTDMHRRTVVLHLIG